MAKPVRSLAKAVSWRIIATLCGMSLVYAFTQDLKTSGMIGLLDCIIKFILYYLHERAWFKIQWGRTKSH